MAVSTTAGVFLLASEHTDSIERFLSHPAFARMVGFDGAPSPNVAAEFVARATAARLAGDAYWNAVVDRGDTKGVSALVGPYSSEPTLVVWIDPEFRRLGYGELVVRLGLEFAFRNLQLAHVHVTADRTDPGHQALLRRFGFSESERLGEYDLTRDIWLAE